MANFEPIVEWLIYQEDSRKKPGAVENIGDGAGMTRFGITSKNFGSVMPAYFWEPSTLFHQALGAAKWFYKQQYWNHLDADTIHDDEPAALLLSASVNLGLGTGVKLLQKVLGTTQDGHIGMVTLTELNEKDPDVVSKLFRAEWEIHYRLIADANPSDQKFLNGWLNRVNFPYPSPLVGSTYAD